ncbi:CWF19-like protein 2 isoform X2 [Conger conger]|uniref:CWF19-like protein 2 isoform X2 n=1 Tax=Conger conger TaxID=82655 RepID=UPI002A5A7C4A|nr:CWF19-like protein 2 isoform X2 [Conger conger]
MAAYGQGFESANNIEARKEFKRKAREQVLREAKEKYEREEKKKELKRARGEDTWMLPQVEQQLQQLEQEHSGKSKKKKEKKSKKSKKEKKKKDKKEKKAAKEDDSSDSSEHPEDEWVEAPAPAHVSQKAWKIQDEKNPSTASPTDTSKRDDWMTFDFLAMKTTSTEERRAEKEKQKEAEREKARCIEQAGLHKLELNPFWKDGGSGLPPEQSATASAKRAVVDDGGLSWLRKSYQRMREQAEREQRSVEAVVAERYGSMELFQKRLEEAENAAGGRRRGAGAERWRRGAPQRSFGRGRGASPPTGGENADRERGWADGRGACRDGHMDRGRDSRGHRGGDRLRDSRTEDSERERREDRRESPPRGRRHNDSPPWGRSHDDSPPRGRSHDDSPPRGRRHDDSPPRGRSHNNSPPRGRSHNNSPPRGRSHDDSPPRGRRHDDSPPRGRRHDDSPPRGRRHDDSPPRGRSHDDSPPRGRRHDDSPPRGRRHDDSPRRESPQRRQRRTNSPPALGSLKAKFLKPTANEDDTCTSWARRNEAAPASGSSGFLRPSDEAGEVPSRTPAWKKPSFRQPEAEEDPRRSVAPEPSSDPDLKDHRGGGSSPPEQPNREANAALRESHRPTPPRTSTDPPQASESEEEEEEDVPILTDEEMNKLGARLVKAELLGNTALVNKLKAQLESAREAKENRGQKGSALIPKSQVSGRAEEDQDVVLFRTDQAGRAWPINAPSQPPEPRGGRRKKKAVETHRDGERVRYFQDDDRTDLQEMVRREKMSTSQDQNALYSRMAAKMMGKQDGDNYTLDDMFVSSAAQKERPGQEEERQRSRAIQEHQRWASLALKCPYCFDSPELPKHLVIALASKAYLCLPNCVSLSEGHCLIAPLQHHTSATGMDEDVWAEIQMFRKALVKMFEDQDQDCVFMETHLNPKNRRHMVYECIPLPRELGDMAPIYFKKALLESDEEWAMNKKVVDLSSKDIRHSIPKGLPYFSVDFGLQGGFAHVIENEHKFPHYFGKEIIGGMLDLEPRRWRKPIRENFDDQRKKVLEFAKWWKPFDCTKTDG